jgi:hypothetical protein
LIPALCFSNRDAKGGSQEDEERREGLNVLGRGRRTVACDPNPTPLLKERGFKFVVLSPFSFRRRG